MKKSYFKPSLNVVRLQSLPLLITLSNQEDKPGGGSRKSAEFEGPTGFLWEDDTKEQ